MMSVLEFFLHYLKIHIVPLCKVGGGEYNEMEGGEIRAANVDLKNRLSGIRDGI